MNVHVRNGVRFNGAKNIENLEWKNLLVLDVYVQLSKYSNLHVPVQNSLNIAIKIVLTTRV